MGKFSFTFRYKHWNLLLDLSGEGLGIITLEQTNPNARGFDRIWKYETEGQVYSISRYIDNSWLVSYEEILHQEGNEPPIPRTLYTCVINSMDPWNFTEDQVALNEGYSFIPVITKVDPIPVAKYYNVKISFEEGISHSTNGYPNETLLTLVDINSTGYDRVWEAEYFVDDTYYFYFKLRYFNNECWVLSVSYGNINDERPFPYYQAEYYSEFPWEATNEQIVSTYHAIPILTGIPVSE